MLAFVLRPLWPPHKKTTLQIDLTPAQATYLLAPLRSEDQQPDYVAELIIAKGRLKLR